MTRRLLAAAVAAVTIAVAAPVAGATGLSVLNPVTGCTYEVWGPTITVYPGPRPGFTTSGGVGQSVSCP